MAIISHPKTILPQGQGTLICYYSLNNPVTDAHYSGQSQYRSEPSPGLVEWDSVAHRIKIKRPADLSIVKRLGGFSFYEANFLRK